MGCRSSQIYVVYGKIWKLGKKGVIIYLRALLGYVTKSKEEGL